MDGSRIWKRGGHEAGRQRLAAVAQFDTTISPTNPSANLSQTYLLCDPVRSCAILCDFMRPTQKGIQGIEDWSCEAATVSSSTSMSRSSVDRNQMIGGGAIRARPPGFVGADLSCVRPAQHRCGRAIRAPSRFYDKLGIILSFGACWSPGGHKKGPPLRNSMRLVYPIAFCGIVLIESPECLAFDAVGRARGKCRIANDRSSNVVQMLPKRARRLANGRGCFAALLDVDSR